MTIEVDGQPSWNQSPDAWDSVIIGGVKLPGICKLRGRRTARHDKPSSPGQSATTQTHLGYEPVGVQITIRMWEDAHWAAFQPLIQQLQPAPGKPSADPFDVKHPALAAYGIAKLYFEEIGLPEETQKGEWQVALVGTEWNPNKGKDETKQPTASSTDLSKKKSAITQRKKPSVTEVEP